METEIRFEPRMEFQPNIHWFADSIKMLPQVHLPARTVAVQHEGRVIVISPSPNLRSIEADLRALGEVTDLVAPNLFHHLGVATARELFPEATLWGVEGFRKSKPTIDWQRGLTEAEWPYHEILPLVNLAGMPKANEAVFFHPGSKTLICQDLAFNLVEPMGFVNSLPFRAFGTYRRFAMSKMFSKFITDRADFLKSMDQLQAFGFENLLMAHGVPLEGNANEQLRSALAERGW